MVKINISLEGENTEEIITELIKIGLSLFKKNRNQIKEILEILANESIDILMDQKILEKGAKLYKKINSEINYEYKKN